MHIKKAAWQDFLGDDKRTDKCGHMGQDDNHNGRQPHSYTRTTDDCKSGRQRFFFSGPHYKLDCTGLRHLK